MGSGKSALCKSSESITSSILQLIPICDGSEENIEPATWQKNIYKKLDHVSSNLFSHHHCEAHFMLEIESPWPLKFNWKKRHVGVQVHLHMKRANGFEVSLAQSLLDHEPKIHEWSKMLLLFCFFMKFIHSSRPHR